MECEIKYEELGEKLFLTFEQNKNKNINLTDYVNMNFYVHEGGKKFEFAPSITILPFIKLDYKGLDNEFKVVVKAQNSNIEINNIDKESINSLIITVLECPPDEIKSYEEYRDLFNKELKRDPLNIRGLKAYASKYKLQYEEEALSSVLMYSKHSKQKFVESSYLEVIRVIDSLNDLKNEEHSNLYNTRLEVAYALFNRYFNSNFDYGVIVLGTYLFSLLASSDKVEKARDVYSKTDLFLTRLYKEESLRVAKYYREILMIKSNSIFTLADYSKLVSSIECTYPLHEFILNVNLSAKLISNNQFEKALNVENKIENLLKDNPTLINDKVNNKGVKYTDIHKSNKAIVRYINEQESLEGIIPTFDTLKYKHIIFYINLLLLLLYKGEKIDTQLLTMLDTYKDNIDDFYDFYISVINILNEERYSDVGNLQIPKLLEVEDGELFDGVIKKIKSLGESTKYQNDLFDIVKTLLIDFNIWDYLDFKGAEE